MGGYIDSGRIIYQNGKEKVMAYGIKKPDGKTNVRLQVLFADGALSEPIELERSQIDKIHVLENYISVTVRDLYEIKHKLNDQWFSYPVIVQGESLGFQKDKNNDITGYIGAKRYGWGAGGFTENVQDEYAALPKFKGNFEEEMWEAVESINQYMAGHIKRQIVLAHALAGAFCGMLDRNIILALVGVSSTGKTTIEKLGVSFFAQPDYERLILKWSATQNALVKRMDALCGVPVLIDDTQLSRVKKYEQIIYSLENGQSTDRLHKGNELCDRYKWAVSIGITAENSLLDTFKDEGSVARMIELPVYKDDLFDDEKQVADIQKLYKNMYGVIGTYFVRTLLEKK